MKGNNMIKVLKELLETFKNIEKLLLEIKVNQKQFQDNLLSDLKYRTRF